MRVAVQRTGEDDQAFSELCEVLTRVEDRELLQEFMLEMFTPNEVTGIARRWRLVKLLHEGVTQREIASKLRLSLCKITRGSRELKRPDSAFKKMLEKRSTP